MLTITVQRRARRGRAERQVQHRAQVVLELAGDRAVLGPVAGVVRPHRQLVDQDPAVGGLEQLDGEDAGDVELAGDPQRDLLRLPASAGSRSGAGATTSWQMPSRWVDATTGYAAAWPLGRPGHQRGQLAAEVDPLLGQQLDAGRRRPRRRRSSQSSGRADEPDALAVVPAAGGLEHAREAERLDVGDRGDHGVARARHAELGEPGPHHGLVLGVHQRLRAGAHGDPVGRERVQVLGRHVLVVEGDHRAARR